METMISQYSLSILKEKKNDSTSNSFLIQLLKLKELISFEMCKKNYHNKNLNYMYNLLLASIVVYIENELLI